MARESTSMPSEAPWELFEAITLRDDRAPKRGQAQRLRGPGAMPSAWPAFLLWADVGRRAMAELERQAEDHTGTGAPVMHGTGAPSSELEPGAAPPSSSSANAGSPPEPAARVREAAEPPHSPEDRHSPRRP